MGLKFNANDFKASNVTTTNNLDNSKTLSFNIHTSSKSGKFHIIKCTHCDTPNQISLELIQKKLDFDNWLKREKQRNGIFSIIDDQKSMCNFRCGKCNMPLADTYSDKEMEIYTAKEHSIEVGKFAESAKRKIGAKQGKPIIDPKKYSQDKLKAMQASKKDDFNLGEKPAGFDERITQTKGDTNG